MPLFSFPKPIVLRICGEDMLVLYIQGMLQLHFKFKILARNDGFATNGFATAVSGSSAGAVVVWCLGVRDFAVGALQ